MKKWIALALAMMMVLGCGASLGEKFIHGIDPDYPPFSYLGENGEYTGFDVEIAKAACEVAGLEYEIFPVDWPTKLISLDAGECDVIWSGMTILQSMIDAGYVISTPYYDNVQVLVVKKDSGITVKEDLAGKVVAVQMGTSGDDLLNDEEDEEIFAWRNTFADLILSENFLIAFTELEGGAADAVFVDLPVAASYVKDRDNLIILDERLGEEQYGMAFRAGDEELCAKIEEAVQTLVENGTYAAIAAKEEYKEIVDNLVFLKEE